MWRVVPCVVAFAGCDLALGIDPIGALDARALDAPRPDDGPAHIGPFAHYPMDSVDAMLHVVDVVGGFDAMCVSCPIMHTGKLGGALSFNVAGDKDRLEIPSAPPFANLDTFSVEGWLEMDALTATSCPWSKPYGGADADSWQLCTANGMLEFITEAGVPGDELTSADVFHADAAWHHVAIVFDGTHKEIWLDGLRVAFGVAAVPAVDNHAIVLGGDVDTVASVPMLKAAFQGELDDLQFFSYALAPEEIVALSGH